MITFGRAESARYHFILCFLQHTGDSSATLSRAGHQVVVGGCAQAMSRRPGDPPALLIKVLPGCGHEPASSLSPEGLIKNADP